MKNYKDLEIYQLAYEFAIETHAISLQLPAYELYEQGSQVSYSFSNKLNIKFILPSVHVSSFF